ncbi:MAG TPA: adenine deaminase [Thermomicrobiales bacterium]|nr:adenine deaminase [Thermomicrobiales bacterium]
MLEHWQRALRIATGGEAADLLLRGGQVVNVFTGEVEHGTIAIADGRIVGIGDYTAAERVVDLDGAFVAPSFIDGHFHTESSLLWITQFARTVVPHGTGAIVTDPHEIVNVAGLSGFNALVDASRDLPLAVYFTVPSCVPASPRETAGAVISAGDIAAGLQNPAAVGLGEMMNFPGVLGGDPEIFARLEAANGWRKDGHAPGLTGRALDGYALSGMTSDHESTSLEEGREKLRRGMMLMIREGSTEHNLRELLPLVNDRTWARCCFASDDRDCTTLLHDGHMNQTLRLAVSEGLDPIRAITMATFNVADYWRLERIGAIAPGYWANLVVLDDLRDFNVREVYWQGQRVAAGGRPGFDVQTAIPAALRNSVHLPNLRAEMLRIPPEAANQAVGTIDGQIVTTLLHVEPAIVDGQPVADVERDLLKLVCVERHRATGNVGAGYVKGFGLRRGALATSIAHDAHNVVAVGTNDADILLAIETLAAMQGGLAAVADGEVLAQLALPVAGILSDQPLEATAAGYERMEAVARELGSSLHSPYGLLAFMALSVIPEARVTDQGFIVV